MKREYTGTLAIRAEGDRSFYLQKEARLVRDMGI
jgi:hypothetical protein